MSTFKILAIGGDGIGPEVTDAALSVLHRAAERGGISLEVERALLGGVSLDACGVPAHDDVLAQAASSDDGVLGAVGGPRWDELPSELRPEKGLLQLRKALGVYANLRPARFFDALVDASPLRRERVEGADFLVVRELLGGIYFGEPRGIRGRKGSRVGLNTMVYDEAGIRRVGKVAFEAAQGRDGRLMSIDKANVLEVGALWRKVISQMGAEEYPNVELTHMYVDAAAMVLVTRPRELDVMVAGNLFGDILSDEAAALTGSLGMLPSASLGEGPGLYEPVHGSAPDIAGQGIANPLATILSMAMLARHSMDRPDLADAIDGAVQDTLADGWRTPDLGGSVGTEAMTSAVLCQLERHLDSREVAA